MGPKTNSQSMLIALCGLVLMGTGCAKYDFSPIELVDQQSTIDVTEPNLVPLSATFMKMSSASASFTQDYLAKNKTTVTFQAIAGTGDFINNLTTASIALKENGINIANFNLTSNPQAYRQTVDIAFLVDVTCSMNPTISSAKTRIVEFINSSRAKGYHTRMCLSTFGDYTVRQCDRFYDNDPSRPETMAQVQELISEVNGLKAGCGADDPGGRDLDENPMQAVMDVEKAPWAVGAQRFAILLTDAGFLYAPGNKGDLGNAAPVYSNVLASLARSHVNIFAATPSLAGYNLKFGGLPGIVEASNGEHFLYTDLVKAKITFETILGRILDRIQTTYAVEYVVDDIQGLDASLPLASRDIKVSLKSAASSDSVRIVGLSSNLPEGRAAYKKKWLISSVKQIDASSVIVTVDGNVMTSGYSISANGEIVFSSTPAPGSKIEISFGYKMISDSLQTQPIVLDANEDLNAIAVFLNGIKAKGTDVRFEKNLEGQWLVFVNASVLGENDPFLIRQSGGLNVQIYRVISL